MATDIIQLPPDSTGKKIAARSYTEGANTVYAQAGYLTTDTAGGNPAEVKQVMPSSTAYGLVVRSLSDNTCTLFYDQVEGAALNTNLWTGSNATQTITQSGGAINLNAGAITTTTTHSRLASVKSLPRFGYFPMVGRFSVKVTNPTATNQNMEIGFAVASAATAPTDGAFFRWTSSGLFGVVSFNSTETLTSALSGVTAGTYTVLEVHLIGRSAIFVIDGVVAGTITATAANSALTSVDRLPVHARVVNSGTASAAPQMSIARATVLQTDLDWGKSWADEISDSQAKGSYQSPLTTFGQTAGWTNNTQATNVSALSNTTASYTTLGGLIQMAQFATALTTDHLMFAYQVPAGYEFHITGVSISNMVYTVVGAGTNALQWGLGVGASAASLATADALGPPPTTWGYRKLVLGVQGSAASTVGTTIGPAIERTFPTPLICDSGRFVSIIMTVLNGTATTTARIVGGVTFNGYFE